MDGDVDKEIANNAKRATSSIISLGYDREQVFAASNMSTEINKLYPYASPTFLLQVAKIAAETMKNYSNMEVARAAAVAAAEALDAGLPEADAIQIANAKASTVYAAYPTDADYLISYWNDQYYNLIHSNVVNKS